MITDGYAQWYADRLWGLLPPIYRTMDAGPAAGANGPLRELVNRIGAQAAVVRRSIDRLGENQSIETCDNWVIPYIGDLVATRLVSCLDAAAQRIDVAKTIYYRRRAGTVGILEELAADIAQRDARVVEFFRRLGRTRHQFDPPLSYVIENPLTGPVGFSGSTLQIDEGLIGAYSGTPAGGFADLRNAYAASTTGSAFDEYFYTADLRAPGETLGHFNIRNLGVFLWWLRAFPILASTPVSNGTADPCFTFDPTGRDIPLFAASQRVGDDASWGEHWVSPDEWQLQVPIREVLWQVASEYLYAQDFSAQSLSVGLLAAGTGGALDQTTLSIHPSRGRFSFVGPPPVGTLAVCYNFGLMSEVGAGGYNNLILSDLSVPPVTTNISGGNVADLNHAFSTVAADANIQINDSLTYAGPTQTLTVPTGCTVVVAAESAQRPVFRWTGGPQNWTIVGGNGQPADTPTVLVLEGIWMQGANIVLQGTFDTVYLRMMTIDPGTAYVEPVPPPKPAPKATPFFATSIDNQPLGTSILFIQGSVGNLVIERSITGPIRAQLGGLVEQLNASISIIQSIPTHVVKGSGKLVNPTIFDPAALADSMFYQANVLARVAVQSSPTLKTELKSYDPADANPSPALIAAMTAAIAQFNPAEAEQAWPLALADLALGFDEGTVSLSQCTVMGPTYTHQLSLSESILDSLATVENPQSGCVRFSAYVTKSNLHQPYRSVQVGPKASLFVSTSFGQPGYAQLLTDADAAILQGTGTNNACGNTATAVAAANTILAGAQNGSEMGVYCLEDVALKRRGLALKYEEYAPIGQLPVWIDVD